MQKLSHRYDSSPFYLVRKTTMVFVKNLRYVEATPILFQVSSLLATSRKIPNYKSSLKNIVFFHLVPVCQTDFNALPPKPDSLFAVPFLLRMFVTESLNVTTTQMNAFVTKQTDTKTKV